MQLAAVHLNPEEQKQIEGAIRAEIISAVGDVVKDVSFVWTFVQDDEARLNITIAIKEVDDPRKWRSGFAGLTSRVMDAMGERLQPVFPMFYATAA